jgi:hypothetical protein
MSPSCDGRLARVVHCTHWLSFHNRPDQSSGTPISVQAATAANDHDPRSAVSHSAEDINRQPSLKWQSFRPDEGAVVGAAKQAPVVGTAEQDNSISALSTPVDLRQRSDFGHAMTSEKACQNRSVLAKTESCRTILGPIPTARSQPLRPFPE